MYINLLRYSKVPSEVQLNARNLANKYKREYCTLTYNKDEFVLEVYAYDVNYHNGNHEDAIKDKLEITEDFAKTLLRRYNK